MSFTNLVDLAARAIGGRAVHCTDDYFASMDRLLEPGRGVFEPDRYTERGKYMDGWESRRRRDGGHDHCTIELGARGVVQAVDIDTNHFLGNHPPYASLEGTDLAPGTTLDEAEWTPLIAPSPLRPGSQNLFAASARQPLTHVRLHLHPDGGVARLRVWGEVVPQFHAPELDDDLAPRLSPDDVDLAAVRHGGKALACSDSFFGPMDNLLLPGRAENMSGGWETRRRRPALGHDWILLRLAAPGHLSVLEIDTLWFRGNYPDRCGVYGLRAEIDTPLTELVAPETAFETVLPPTPLGPHERRFVDALEARGPFTHLRLDIHPDGGLSRFRAWGTPA